MKIVKSLEMKTKLMTPRGEQEYPIAISKYMQSSINNLVASRTRCVCIFDNIADYTYSVRGTNYTKLSPIDVVGYIDGIDWDTNEIILEIDEKYGTEGDPAFISKEDRELYQLRTRALFILHHNEESGQLEAQIQQLFGFDLIRVERNEQE